MTEPFIGEIRIFAGTFPPDGWAFCSGQLLPINQFTALFSILGNVYGGNGSTTFALPNLQARAPMHFGQGDGLTARSLGQQGGATAVTLTTDQIPAHTHELMGSSLPGNSNDPTNRSLARSFGGNVYTQSNSNPVLLAADLVGTAGNNQPHNNLQPYITLNFCIALEGIYPPRP